MADVAATQTAAPAATVAAAKAKSAYDFRIAANDVERTDIGGKFHINGKGFGDEVGSVAINGRNAYVTLTNEAPHKAMWDDENIYGMLPPMSVSGEVVVTTKDGKTQRGFLKLTDRKRPDDLRADATDDEAASKLTSAGH